ncbi:MAG: hypothetical protein ACC645_07550 [Pirellulales bacterium]
MSPRHSAVDILDRDFLDLRTRLLDLAAGLDRVERGEGSVQDDRRMANIRKAIAILADSGEDRAEALQLVFSLPYHPQWQSRFVAPGSGD